MYCMSIYILPDTLIDEIHGMLNSIWWGSKKESRMGVNWLRWDKLTLRKDQGGMVFQDLKGFNLALLGNQAWSFCE